VHLSCQINPGWIEYLKYPTFIQALDSLHRSHVVLSFPLDFQFHGIKRIDLDSILPQVDPDPVITLPAGLDVLKMLTQGLQDLIEMIPVEFGEDNEFVLVHNSQSILAAFFIYNRKCRCQSS